MSTFEPKILEKHEQILSPWVTLVTRTVDFATGNKPQTYHAFAQRDYVSILALTPDKEVILVKQYRPACEAFTIEIPGGLLEEGESPADCAIRELFEETGYRAKQVHAFKPVIAEPGRLSNYIHGFFTGQAVLDRSDWKRESGLSSFAVPLNEFRTMLLEGQISNSLHVAIAGQALFAGLI